MSSTLCRALFVTDWLPIGPEWIAAGISKRQHLLIDSLKHLGVDIDVLIYLPHMSYDGSEEHVREIERELGVLWGGVFRVTLCRRAMPSETKSFWAYYLSPAKSLFHQKGYAEFAGTLQVSAFEQCLEDKPDLVFVHRLKSMVPALLTKKNIPPLFLDLDDIEHITFRRRVAVPPVWPSKRLEYLQIPALMAGERSAIKLSRKTFVCSELDRSKLQGLFRTKNVESVPNAVALQPVSPPSLSPTLLFLGHYGYAPNRSGAEYFLDQVWPRILAAKPNAQAIIAGADPESIRHHRSPPPGVTFPGFVSALNELYARTKVVICPILTGGGTRIKIMEAAAYGRPIIATHVGAEGIDLRDGDEILLRNTPASFADACIELLGNDAAARDLGERARQAIAEKYDRSQVIDRLASILSEHSHIPLQSLSQTPTRHGEDSNAD